MPDLSDKEQHNELVNTFFEKDWGWWPDVYREDLPKGFISYEVIKRKEVFLKAFDETTCPSRPLKVLDCGCGPGELVKEMLSRGHHVWGLDINEKYLSMVPKHERVSIHIGDIESMPFEDNFFDAVICLGVICYLKDPNKAIRELNRITKPGGYVYVSVPNLFMVNKFIDPYYVIVGWYKYLKRTKAKKINEFKTTAIKRFNLDRLNSSFVNGRFQIEKIHNISFGPVTFWRKAIFKISTSIALSEKLLRRSQGILSSPLTFLSNHWVHVLKK